MINQERYRARPIAANVTDTLNGISLGGFIAVTAGTITIAASDGTPILTAFPVTAGTVYGLPMLLRGHGASFTTAGGASGTILVGN